MVLEEVSLVCMGGGGVGVRGRSGWWESVEGCVGEDVFVQRLAEEVVVRGSSGSLNLLR